MLRTSVALIFLLLQSASLLLAQQATIVNNLQIVAITNATDIIRPFGTTGETQAGQVTLPTAQPPTVTTGTQTCTDNCPECRFQTYSEGQWGDQRSCSADSPASCLRQTDNFTRCFPAGVQAGCGEGFTITITEPSLIPQLLPAAATECGQDPNCAGRTYTLRQRYSNPSAFNEAGHLAGQMLAMGLNLGFDRCLPNFSEACTAYEDLFLCDIGYFSASSKRNPPGTFLSCVPFYNMTIRQVADMANQVLGGCRSACEHPSVLASGLSSNGSCISGKDLLQCALMINEGFAGNNILSTAPWFSLSACPARNNPSSANTAPDRKRQGATLDVNSPVTVNAIGATIASPVSATVSSPISATVIGVTIQPSAGSGQVVVPPPPSDGVIVVVPSQQQQNNQGSGAAPIVGSVSLLMLAATTFLFLA